MEANPKSAKAQEKAIKRRARHYAKDNCRKCHGRGFTSVFVPDDGGPRKVVICDCALHGFKELQPEKSIAEILDVRVE